MSCVLGVSSAGEQEFTVIILGKVFLLQVVEKVHNVATSLKPNHLYTQSFYRATGVRITCLICLILLHFAPRSQESGWRQN